jgi:16S rRNA (uracil1498-N3)-methyltransferase
MRRIRIFVDAALDAGAQAALPEPAIQHVVRVLRLGPGDTIVLFNGDGHDYEARLTATGKRDGSAEVLQRVPPAAAESPLRLTLAQAMARGEKMDWILQKAAELGVAAVVPLSSERTEVRLGAERMERRLQHWQGVLVAACEQCGRATLPELSGPVPLDRFAAGAAEGLRLVLDPDAATGIAGLPAGFERATLAVGPEGGWSERELDALRLAGFTGLRLGPRVLRTETAGIAALAALQARFGDLG